MSTGKAAHAPGCNTSRYQGRKCQLSMSRIYNNYVTGFAKRGFPHTSNSMNLEGHTSVLKNMLTLEFFHPLSHVGTHY